MFTRLLNGLEKLLVLGLALVFTVPLGVAGWLQYSQNTSPYTAWLRNSTLVGVQIPPQEVPCTTATVFASRFQSALAQNFDFHFPGREALIRMVNEFDLRVLQSAPAGLLCGGRPLSIIEKPYVEEYCLQRPDSDTLRPMVENLRRMQDFCTARGIAFALVITPNKASVYPENLPADWLRRYRTGPRAYDQLVALLQQGHIHYVDGHRIALRLRADTNVPVFPAGGVHWGDEPALATMNALLQELASQGLGVSPVTDYTKEISDEPTDQDVDMMYLINTMYQWHYPVATITVQPDLPPNTHRPNLVWIGGSFVWKMFHMLRVSQKLSEQDFYSYYTLAKHSAAGGRAVPIGQPPPPMNFDTDIFAADALVLELNEQAIWPGAHVQRFLHDALAVLPDPHAPRAPFRYELATPPPR